MMNITKNAEIVYSLEKRYAERNNPVKLFMQLQTFHYRENFRFANMMKIKLLPLDASNNPEKQTTRSLFFVSLL